MGLQRKSLESPRGYKGSKHSVGVRGRLISASPHSVFSHFNTVINHADRQELGVEEHCSGRGVGCSRPAPLSLSAIFALWDVSLRGWKQGRRLLKPGALGAPKIDGCVTRPLAVEAQARFLPGRYLGSSWNLS